MVLNIVQHPISEIRDADECTGTFSGTRKQRWLTALPDATNASCMDGRRSQNCLHHLIAKLRLLLTEKKYKTESLTTYAAINLKEDNAVEDQV